MAQLQGSSNAEALLEQALQNNSNTAFIANALHNGNSLEGIARSMAQAKGVDLEQLIQQLIT